MFSYVLSLDCSHDPSHSSISLQPPVVTIYERLPDLTSGRPVLALETVQKTLSICHGSQDPRPLRRMPVRVDTGHRRLRALLTAPPIRVAHEEELALSKVLQAREVGRCVWVAAVCGAAGSPGLEQRRDPAGVGDVITQRQPAVDVQKPAIGPWNRKVGVLVYEALGQFRERLGRLVVPPAVDISPVLIAATARRVERVRYLVFDDEAKGTVCDVIGDVGTPDGELHDPRRDLDVVSGRIVRGIHNGDARGPSAMIHRFSHHRPSVLYGEHGHGKGILKIRAGADAECLVEGPEGIWIGNIRTLRRVADVWRYVAHLLHRLLGRLGIHPCASLQRCDKLILDIGNDLTPEILGGLRKSPFDEESAEHPSEAFVNMASTDVPALGPGVRRKAFELANKGCVWLDDWRVDVRVEYLRCLPDEVAAQSRVAGSADNVFEFPHVIGRRNNQPLHFVVGR